MQKHFIDIQLEIFKAHSKEIDILKNEITQITLEKQKDKRSAHYIFEANKDLLLEIEKHKERIREIGLEVQQQEKVTEEWQKLHSEKVSRIKELENENLYLMKMHDPYKATISKYKTRDRKSLYLLSLLHFKGYPVMEIYQNEVRHLSTARLRSYTKNYTEGLDADEDEYTLESLSLTQEFDVNFLCNTNTKLRNIQSEESHNLKKLYNQLFTETESEETRRSKSSETKHYTSADENEVFEDSGHLSSTYTMLRSNSLADVSRMLLKRRTSSPTTRITSFWPRVRNTCSGCDLKIKRAEVFSISKQNTI